MPKYCSKCGEKISDKKESNAVEPFLLLFFVIILYIISLFI